MDKIIDTDLQESYDMVLSMDVINSITKTRGDSSVIILKIRKNRNDSLSEADNRSIRRKKIINDILK
jgi:hypothetical protein